MKKQKDELLSRREFFKRTVQKTLPFMAALSLPSFLFSCGDDDPINNAEGCTDCTNSCSDSCSKVCMDNCENGNNNNSSGCSDCSNECSVNCQDSCKDNANNSNEPQDANAVDLGLSALWATMNIGATSPEDVGDEYAWGNIPGMPYSEVQELRNNPDIMNICGTEYDIVTYTLGAPWRLPTDIEIKELVELCSFTDDKVNGVRGYTATGNNGNSIFLPVQDNGIGIYLSGIKKSASNEMVYILGLSPDDIRLAASSMTPFWVRPVRDGGSGCKDCSAGCSKNCSADCTNGCKVACGSDCTNSCQTFCAKNCSTQCKEGCGLECEGGCVEGCYSGCEGDCQQGCVNGCFAQCDGYCRFQCGTGCTAVAG